MSVSRKRPAADAANLPEKSKQANEVKERGDLGSNLVAAEAVVEPKSVKQRTIHRGIRTQELVVLRKLQSKRPDFQSLSKLQVTRAQLMPVAVVASTVDQKPSLANGKDKPTIKPTIPRFAAPKPRRPGTPIFALAQSIANQSRPGSVPIIKSSVTAFNTARPRPQSGGPASLLVERQRRGAVVEVYSARLAAAAAAAAVEEAKIEAALLAAAAAAEEVKAVPAAVIEDAAATLLATSASSMLDDVRQRLKVMSPFKKEVTEQAAPLAAAAARISPIINKATVSSPRKKAAAAAAPMRDEVSVVSPAIDFFPKIILPEVAAMEIDSGCEALFDEDGDVIMRPRKYRG